MKANSSKQCASMSPTPSKILDDNSLFSDDCDISDDLTSESKVNHVYDSSRVIQIRNSLVISKGSPLRKMNTSISPKYQTLRQAPCDRGNSFCLKLQPSKSVEKPCEGVKKPRSWTSTRKNWESTRKPSIEILLNLQKKLQETPLVDLKKTEDVWSPPKLLPE